MALAFAVAASDSTAAVIDSKIKLANLGDVTLSTRPAVLLGGYDGEWRLPFTIDYEVAHGLSLFGGGGLAYGMDDLEELRWDGDWSAWMSR